MSRRPHDAIGLVWPAFARRAWRVRRRDGRRTLKRRAAIRAAALTLRPALALALVVALMLVLADESRSSLTVVTAIALSALLLEVLARPPRTRRDPRILRDIRPILLQPANTAPEEKRVGRIIRARPDIPSPGLPPHRPRTRMSDRRPGPHVDEVE